ncbi:MULTISPECIES: high-affinity branched-chain amino acid ABC transporter permease LivM [Desulfovibrio]|uniref:Branched-chain amino acid transport system permease protein n=3 Tax=Desulfovibrio TaxID=872 RepID=A0AA94HSP5_DESDE|nr:MULTISPECIES: high-affinity branched-chain amino acid ABC transporter permease LivM [Desulfovibrio]ATD81568.1 branched-chain amino acid ABC transporter permease [Desulfovibrio sp. G11]MDY0202683.1 high-affinity branched-chain amino acid ABC transporter permease LivM [Desulfovibrio desulfuricans]SFW46713.1 branched-chain amino acid transport system permease protein [Desulfovibrio desulfuricans]SPD34285.1 ABC transporter, branched-chain amino acid transport [Desulfovibrio sp. G11]
MQRVIKAAIAALWFMVLTLPVLGIKLNTIESTVTWRLDRIVLLGVGIFALALIWDWCFSRKARGLSIIRLPHNFSLGSGMAALSERPALMAGSLTILAVIMIAMPLVVSFYQTNIMISALLYIMLALGLNIVVGLAGQLVLGYVAFYAVGAYAYGLLHQFFGWGFWVCLPVGGFVAVIFGLALGFPVLRLRGDYLAIVTLGFGEIVRLALQNWTSLTGGPRGVGDIPRPGFFGMDMDISTSTTYVYYLVLAAVAITIIVISRLKNSRVGLALQALREDEIACEAMGIDITRVKLSAFALGSCWAGFAGVIFAAKTTYINPSSFTFMESAMILSMVVLGGMGSITGVVIAALILILAPEYLRAFSEYRMLIFGAIMVIMMIFRPQGLISGERRRYRISGLHESKGGRQ